MTIVYVVIFVISSIVWIECPDFLPTPAFKALGLKQSCYDTHYDTTFLIMNEDKYLETLKIIQENPNACLLRSEKYVLTY